jgi:ankyrin repeat protein
MTFLHNLVFERNSRTITLLRHRYPFLLDLSVKNNSGMTPLEYAQSFRFDELITALSESTVEYKNLGVIDYDQSGFNSLMIAALRGDISMAQQFVDGKGSMNAVAQDTFNDTAFHYALRCNKIEFVQWLLNHGSSVTIKNNDGDMALHVLARLVNSSLFNVLLPTITKQPTLLNMQNKNGDTPIHILVARKAFDLLKLEIDQFCSSIDFSVRNVQNESPEEVAQRIDDQKIVSLIVSAFRRQEARRK